MKEELTKLIEKAISGDSSAFEQLMELEAQHIFYVSYKLMGNMLDAEDAVQEAMLKMYSHIGELKHAYAFQNWLSQTVTRTCLDMKKKLIRNDYDYLETKDDLSEMRREFLPQEYIEDVNKREFLMEVIDGLPEHYRASLLLFYYEGMSYQEIAKALETTEKQVDNSLLRAKRKIRRLLEDRFGEIDTLSIFQGVGIPVLGQAFRLEAVDAIPAEALTRIVSTVGVGALGTAAKAAGGANAMSTAGAASTASAGTASQTAAAGGLTATSKIVIGMVAATTAVSGSAYCLFQGNEATAEGFAAVPVQEAAAILTLEDMIGEEGAQTLRAYTAGEADEELWQDYLDQLAAPFFSCLTVEQTVYTLYRLEKQDKMLLILERVGDEGLEVVYHFTDSHEEPPKRGDLIRSMERWRS